MADSRLSLEEFKKDTPPGWDPHLPNYLFRAYEEKFMLWKIMVRDVYQPHEIGPLVVGRLKNAANRLAMKIKMVFATGQVLEGPEAIGMAAQPALEVGDITTEAGQALSVIVVKPDPVQCS